EVVEGNVRTLCHIGGRGGGSHPSGCLSSPISASARRQLRCSLEKSRDRDFSLAAESARLAGQAPLHRLHAAGIAAGGDDAEVGARLPERLLVNVGLGGRILDDARLLGATSELLPKELLRARAALGRLCRLRCFTRGLAGGLARFGVQSLAGVDDGAAANLGELHEVGRRGGGIGLERCERPIARFAGRATPVFALAPPAPRSLAR